MKKKLTFKQKIYPVLLTISRWLNGLYYKIEIKEYERFDDHVYNEDYKRWAKNINFFFDFTEIDRKQSILRPLNEQLFKLERELELLNKQIKPLKEEILSEMKPLEIEINKALAEFNENKKTYFKR